MKNTLIVILITLLISSFAFPFYDQNADSHKKILIDVNAKDELTISKLGKLVKVVPLQHTTSDLFLSRNRVILDLQIKVLTDTHWFQPKILKPMMQNTTSSINGETVSLIL